MGLSAHGDIPRHERPQKQAPSRCHPQRDRIPVAAIPTRLRHDRCKRTSHAPHHSPRHPARPRPDDPGPDLLAKNLVFCSEGSPAGFDTAQYTSATDNDAAEPIYNRLVEFERGGTAVHPALATFWEISEDGMRYTFHLREGVKFHGNKDFTPSRDFSADDVLFTFNRMLDKRHPFRRAYPTEFPYFVSMGLDKNIAKVEKTGPLTVVFTLNSVDAAFIQNLAMSFASILSAEYADHLLAEGRASDINQKPIGTGPFVFQRYQKDSQIRYKGNPAYWAPEQVKLDNLVFSINIDPSVRIQKLRRNECQVTLHPRPADLPAIKADSKLSVLHKPGFNLGYIAYNTQHPPFDRLEVRQAMDMAVNKQAIIQAVYQDSGQAAVNAMPPTQWSYDKTIKDAGFNPAKARELLQAAGVKEGTEVTLWAMPVQRPYNPNAKLMAEMLQADWAKVGIKARIVSYEWGIPQAHEKRRARHRPDRLDRRQRRPGQLAGDSVQLRCHRQQQLLPVVRP